MQEGQKENVLLSYNQISSALLFYSIKKQNQITGGKGWKGIGDYNGNNQYLCVNMQMCFSQYPSQRLQN